MEFLNWSVETFASKIPYLYTAISAAGCNYAGATGLEPGLLQRGYVTRHGVYYALGRHVDDLARLISGCGRQE